MKSRARFLLSAAGAFAALVAAAPATAAQSFMRIDGVNGPVVHEGQPGWIRIEDIHLPPPPGSGPVRSGSGTFTFTKQMDSASHGLARACLSGSPLVKGEIHIHRSPERGAYEKYIVYDLRLTLCPEHGAAFESWHAAYTRMERQIVTPAGEKGQPN